MNFVCKHKVIIVLVLLISAAFAWYGFSDRSGNAPLLTSEQLNPVTEAAEKGLVEALITLRSIALTGTIFSDPAFLNLQDFGTQIVPEPISRRDPFAPLSR